MEIYLLRFVTAETELSHVFETARPNAEKACSKASSESPRVKTPTLTERGS